MTILGYRWLKSSVYVVMLLLFYSIAASQAVQSFSYKWTSIATHKQYSLDKVFNGTTPKPYAFRVLVPLTINAIVDFTPNELLRPILERSKNTLIANIGAEAHEWDDRIVLSYGLTLVSGFIFLLATMLILRQLAIKVLVLHERKYKFISDVSPILFCLFLSITYRVYNGFVYDYFELFIILAYILLCVNQRFILLLGILALAVLNKETAIFLPVLGLAINFSRNNSFLRPDVVRFVTEFFVVIVGFFLVRYMLRDHPGASVEFHLIGNLNFWLSAVTYFSITTPHLQVIPLPKPTNIIVAIPILFVIFRYWKCMPRMLTTLFLTSTCINLPLFFLFSYRDEFRNLSLMFPSLYLAATHSLIHYYKDDNIGVAR